LGDRQTINLEGEQVTSLLEIEQAISKSKNIVPQLKVDEKPLRPKATKRGLDSFFKKDDQPIREYNQEDDLLITIGREGLSIMIDELIENLNSEAILEFLVGEDIDYLSKEKYYYISEPRRIKKELQKLLFAFEEEVHKGGPLQSYENKYFKIEVDHCDSGVTATGTEFYIPCFDIAFKLPGSTKTVHCSSATEAAAIFSKLISQ
jgi:hypothetical protein